MRGTRVFSSLVLCLVLLAGALPVVSFGGGAAEAATSRYARITIHKAECPLDAPGDIYEACHDNVLAGVEFRVAGVIRETDANGVVSWAPSAGTHLIEEDPFVVDQYSGSYIVCRDQVTGRALFGGRDTDGRITITTTGGQPVVCDWYNRTAPGPTGSITIDKFYISPFVEPWIPQSDTCLALAADAGGVPGAETGIEGCIAAEEIDQEFGAAVLTFAEVDPGTYCVVETVAPDNFVIADPVCGVEVGAGKNTSMFVDNFLDAGDVEIFDRVCLSDERAGSVDFFISSLNAAESFECRFAGEGEHFYSLTPVGGTPGEPEPTDDFGAAGFSPVAPGEYTVTLFEGDTAVATSDPFTVVSQELIEIEVIFYVAEEVEATNEEEAPAAATPSA